MNGSSWKWVSVAGGVLALLFGVWKVDDRYAKCEQVEKELRSQEQKVVQTLDVFKRQLDYEGQYKRLETVKDQQRQNRMLLKKMPNDPELREQEEELRQERAKIENRLIELEKKK